MKNDAIYKAECIEIWNNFNPNPVVDKLKITCIPKKPKPESIANFGLPSDDRIFRPVLPKVVQDNAGEIWFEGYETLEKEDEFLDKIADWRKNGYWFYNDHKLEWITGDHWYALNCMSIMSKIRDKETGRLIPKRQLPTFIDAQQDIFWAWEECMKARYVSGLLVFGPRRLGKSLCGYGTILNSATRTFDANYTMQAQSRDLVKALYRELTEIWTHAPKHPNLSPPFDPKTAGGLHFVATAKMNKKTMLLQKSVENLNTHILYGTNKSSKFDGLFVFISFLDEICKWDNQDITETVATMVETLKMGGLEPVGKMYAATTAENIGGKTLEPFTRLWRSSNCDNRDVLGTTTSGLLGVFMSGAKGYRHDPEEDGKLPEMFQKPTVNKHGHSNIELATEIILYMRSRRKGEELIKFIRKYPLNENEPLVFGNSTCPFDTERLNDQLNHNEYIRATVNDRIVRGEFIHVPGREWREVMFRPSADGYHLISWMPEAQDRNKWEMHGHLIKPTRRYCAMGSDPFSHKYHEDKKFSKGALATLCLGYPGTHSNVGFVHTYCHRPESPEVFLDENLKAAMFYSSPIYMENMKSDLLTLARTRGFELFFEKNPLNLSQKNPGIATKNQTHRDTLVNNLMAYVADYVGKLVSMDKDGNEIIEYGDCPHDELLLDWLGFDSMSWTKSDLTVASMMALCALRKPVYAPLTGFRNFSDYF